MRHPATYDTASRAVVQRLILTGKQAGNDDFMILMSCMSYLRSRYKTECQSFCAIRDEARDLARLPVMELTAAMVD